MRQYDKLMVFFIAVCVSASSWGQTASDYRASADAGDKIAQFNLGLCYYYGIGVDKDEKTAIDWCKRAAEQGNQKAQEFLDEIS